MLKYEHAYLYYITFDLNFFVCDNEDIQIEGDMNVATLFCLDIFIENICIKKFNKNLE